MQPLSFPAPLGQAKIYLYSKNVDMRKSFDGLHAIVQSEFQRDIRLGDLFLFLNRRLDRIKLIHWDRDGLVDLDEAFGTRHLPETALRSGRRSGRDGRDRPGDVARGDRTGERETTSPLPRSTQRRHEQAAPRTASASMIAKNIFRNSVEKKRVSTCAFSRSRYHRWHDRAAAKFRTIWKPAKRCHADAGRDHHLASDDDRIAGEEDRGTRPRNGEAAEAAEPFRQRPSQREANPHRSETRLGCRSKAARSSRPLGPRRRRKPKRSSRPTR